MLQKEVMVIRSPSLPECVFSSFKGAPEVPHRSPVPGQTQVNKSRVMRQGRNRPGQMCVGDP